MGYADHLHSAAMGQRPNCWGNDQSYDPADVECAECRFRHSCRTEVQRTEQGQAVHVRPYAQHPYRRREPIDVDAGNYEPGLVAAGEKPVERFFKDAAGGALRGMFYEMWQFWKNFRIR